MRLVLVLITLNLIFSQKDQISDEQSKAIMEITKDIDKAPDFSLLSLNDSTYTLSKLQGSIVLVNFWATWCGPCIMEIKDFNEIYKKYKEKGLEILGISISDSKKQLENFTKSYKIDYPVLYGKGSEINKIIKDYGGVYAVPTSFVIDREGKIIWQYPGAILKDYDPQTYANLIYEIEKNIE